MLSQPLKAGILHPVRLPKAAFAWAERFQAVGLWSNAAGCSRMRRLAIILPAVEASRERML